MTSRACVVSGNRAGPNGSVSFTVGSPTFSDLKPLAPDSYVIVSGTILTKLAQGGHMTKDEEQALLSPFFDYNGYSLAYFKSLAGTQSDFDEATTELILRKQCALDPDKYFSLGYFLRAHGKIDDAAEADRNGAKLANDQVLMANSIQPLVEYDFAHDKKDEAEQLAEKAAEVYSASGIETYIWVLMKLNRKDEAEDWAKKEADRYDPAYLGAFYAKYQDLYPDKYKALEQSMFPNGMRHVTLSSFSGAPKSGCQITSDSSMLRYAGMEQGDVIVALDSYEVTSESTYYFIRSISQDPKMDLIVWHDGKYIEVTSSPPNRKFGVNLGDYPPQ